MQTRQRLTAFMLMTIVILIWAGSFVCIRIGLKEMPPATLALGRFIVASPLVVGYMFLTQRKMAWKNIPLKKDFILYVALGVSGGSLLYVLQFYSLKFITSTAGSILINLNVVFTTLLSAAFLKETMTKRKLIGVLLAFSGVVVLATKNTHNPSSGSFGPMGALLMAGAAFCWAAYTILSKKALDRYSATAVTSITFCMGTLFLLPFALAETSLEALLNASLITWLSILYLAVPSSVIAYISWNYVLARIDTTKLAVSLYMIPIPTAILSYFILGETVTSTLVLGGILVITGILLTESSRS